MNVKRHETTSTSTLYSPEANHTEMMMSDVLSNRFNADELWFVCDICADFYALLQHFWSQLNIFGMFLFFQMKKKTKEKKIVFCKIVKFKYLRLAR